MNKKLLALGLLALAILTGCRNRESEELSKASDIPSLSKEEIKADLNFENAVYATKEDGQVDINLKNMDNANSKAIETKSPPERVWEEEQIAFDDITLPEEVRLEDNSLGKLTIPKINLSVSIYETDDEMEAMTEGVAHFKETSCFNGNVGLAGHNSGVNEYFGKLHTLVPGDKVILETALGKREYNVFKSYEIDESDWSVLDRTEENIITMITCVNHDKTKRLCVKAISV